MRFLLLPFSWIYGSVVFLRNRLYDWGILKSTTFNTPIIVVGNLAVGGTGKTPHIEYLIRQLASHYRIAVLSRGYGRKTQGYILATATTNAREIGDEPYQIFAKNKNIILAVCEDRVTGIKNLLQEPQPPEVILLDDAFQHRSIKAGLNIVLTDAKKPFYKDFMLPAGNLRDNKREIKRAQALIFSKSNAKISVEESKKITNKYPNLALLRSSIKYLDPQSFFPKKQTKTPSNKIIVVSGIANPKPLLEYLKKTYNIVEKINYQDHKDYSDNIVKQILEKKRNFVNERISILTTEKDFVKLKELVQPDDDFYYLPIEVDFADSDKEIFNQLITSYIDNQLKIINNT